MSKYIQPGAFFRDVHGIVITIIRFEPESQKVVYSRPGYEWECAAPLITFRARFKRIDK